VPTKIELYRLKAQECAEHAELTLEPETKRQFEDAARQWVELAERLRKGGGDY
jgi:hypothetical protein